MLAQQAEIWRAQGRIIAMTNGCFDLLHAGHIFSLETARSYGNVLVVAINCDDSVRRLKGPERPLNTQDDRARVLAALACVDAVTIFEEDTSQKILELIRPDVFIKGGDYTAETIPERDVVKAYGGRVVATPLLPGRSTTALISSCR